MLIRGDYRSSNPRLVDGADMSICLKIKWSVRPERWHEYDVFSESSTVRLQGNNRELVRRALVLGIWNVEEDSNVVVLPPIPCAFLFEVLRKPKKHIFDFVPENPFTPGSKVHTREGIRFISFKTPSLSYARILKHNLIFSSASLHTLYL